MYSGGYQEWEMEALRCWVKDTNLHLEDEEFWSPDPQRGNIINVVIIAIVFIKFLRDQVLDVLTTEKK